METFGSLRVTSTTTFIPDIALIRTRAHLGVISIPVVSFSPWDMFVAFGIGRKDDSLSKRVG